jgi:hypothetical protein
MGSRPLFLMAEADSGDTRNLITLRAKSEFLVLAPTPAEKTETFCSTPAGNKDKDSYNTRNCS